MEWSRTQPISKTLKSIRRRKRPRRRVARRKMIIRKEIR